MPKSKYILQPSEIQKMLSSKEILDSLENDRIPKIPRKKAQRAGKRRRRRRRKAGKKWSVQRSSVDPQGYSIRFDGDEIGNAEEEHEKGTLNLPGIGHFKVGSMRRSDLHDVSGFMGGAGHMKVHDDQFEGGMKKVIKRFKLTEDISMIGHPELQEAKRLSDLKKREKRRMVVKAKEGAPPCDSADDALSADEPTTHRGKSQGNNNNNNDTDNADNEGGDNNNDDSGDGGDGGGGGGDDDNNNCNNNNYNNNSVKAPSKPEGPKPSSTSSSVTPMKRRLKHGEGVFLSSDYMRVERLIMEAEANKFELALAAKTAKEKALRRKQETERLQVKARERKMKIKNKMMFATKKAAMIEGFTGGAYLKGRQHEEAGSSETGSEVEDGKRREEQKSAGKKNECAAPEVSSGKSRGARKNVKDGPGRSPIPSKPATPMRKRTLTRKSISQNNFRRERGLTLKSPKAVGFTNARPEGVNASKELSHGGEPASPSTPSGKLTVEELRQVHRNHMLELQMEKNTRALLQSESSLRRKTHNLSAMEEEDRARTLISFRAERWLSLVYIGKWAAFMARNYRIVAYLQGESQEEEEEGNSILVAEVFRVRAAMKVLVKHAARFLEKLYVVKKKAALKRLKILLGSKIDSYSDDIRDRHCDTIVHFMKNTKFNFAVFVTVIHQFRDKVITCQRATRAYIACRHARFETLKHWWIDAERGWINKWKINKKTTDVYNVAMTTPAPVKLRNSLILECLNREMHGHMAKRTLHDEKVKQTEMVIKKVGLNDARAVVRGEVHNWRNERVVLKRPYFALYTKMKKESIMQIMIRLSHKKMDEFRRELDTETGIVLLDRVEDCLCDLQKHIKSYNEGSNMPDKLTKMDDERRPFTGMVSKLNAGRRKRKVAAARTSAAINDSLNFNNM